MEIVRRRIGTGVELCGESWGSGFKSSVRGWRGGVNELRRCADGTFRLVGMLRMHSDEMEGWRCMRW